MLGGYQTNLESVTRLNENFRTVLHTGPHSQLVLMSLKPGEDIGQEVHEVDQFFKLEVGQLKATLDGYDMELKEGDCLVVPAGVEHNILNTSETNAAKLYTVYSPAQHPDGTRHATKEEAMKSE